MRINVGGAMHAKNIQSPMFNDGQIHIAKWVRNALDLNDGDELLFEVVDNVSAGSAQPIWVGKKHPI